MVARSSACAVGELDARMIEPLCGLASLLVALHERYRAHKRARGALDFDDLIEYAAALVTGEYGEDAARRACRPYRAVLVDEFQDVDEFQARIVRALARGGAGEAAGGRLAGGRLFIVGDDKQSIYRFRGADVSVFARLGAEIAAAEQGAAVSAVELRDCFRTLPRPLAVINASFARLFAPAGERRAPFEAAPAPLVARREGWGEERGSVELLLAEAPRKGDASDALAGGLDEPELLARYLRRRVEAGATEVHVREADDAERLRALAWGDIAVLFRARTHLKRYEAAFARHQIPFTVHAGSGFWASEEVVDAVNLLRVLADPEDDLTLLAVLRSPLALVPDRALYVLARARPHGSLWARLEHAVASPEALVHAGLDGDEANALVRAGRLLTGLRARAHSEAAAALLRNAIEFSGALCAYVAGPRGNQAAANLEKLLDQVRLFERRALTGLGELVERLVLLSEEQAREAEAAWEPQGEGEGAVQLMTVHAAKGLEFPLVVVPECGARAVVSDAREAAIMEELGREGADGLPCYEVALKVPDPWRGGQHSEPGLRRLLRERAADKARAESRRLLYVAMTRARDHLVLSGTVKEGGAASNESWLALLAAAWGGDDASAVLAGEEVRIEADQETIEVPIVRAEALLDIEPPAAGIGAVSWPIAPPAAKERAAPAPAPQTARLLARPARPYLSPSRWKLYRGCPLRFGYRVVLGLEEPVVRDGAKGLDPRLAMARGTAVHRLFELGLLDAEALESAIDRVLAELGAEADAALRAEVERAAARAVERYARSALRAEIARARARWHEVPFAIRLGAGEIEGTIDLLCQRADSTLLVVDWKTDRGAPDDERALADYVERSGYDLQLDLYAYAAWRLLGARDGEEALVRACLFFTWSGAVHTRTYGRSALEAVGARAESDLAAIARGLFEPGAEPPCARCGFAAPQGGGAGARPICAHAAAVRRSGA